LKSGVWQTNSAWLSFAAGLTLFLNSLGKFCKLFCPSALIRPVRQAITFTAMTNCVSPARTADNQSLSLTLIAELRQLGEFFVHAIQLPLDDSNLDVKTSDLWIESL